MIWEAIFILYFYVDKNKSMYEHMFLNILKKSTGSILLLKFPNYAESYYIFFSPIYILTFLKETYKSA